MTRLLPSLVLAVIANAYFPATPIAAAVVARGSSSLALPLGASDGWYDFSVRVNGRADLSRHFAGRMETGADSTSDPAMHGPAIASQYRVG